MLTEEMDTALAHARGVLERALEERDLTVHGMSRDAENAARDHAAELEEVRLSLREALAKTEESERQSELREQTIRRLAGYESALEEERKTRGDIELQLVASQKTSEELRARVLSLEDDYREMRKVSNLVVLEKKLADLNAENQVLRKSLSNTRTHAAMCSAQGRAAFDNSKADTKDAVPPPPESQPASEDEKETPGEKKDTTATGEGTGLHEALRLEEETGAPSPVRGLKTKTIKGVEYFASADTLFRIEPNGEKGEALAVLSKDSNGRTRVSWM